LPFLFSTGKIYAKNLETGREQKWQISTNRIEDIIYADGKFIIYENTNVLDKLYIYSSGSFDLQPRDFTIKLTNPYKTDGEYNEYLGQTHCHYIPDVPTWSKLFNGEPTPSFTVNKYKDAGYDFVALTEHNVLIPKPSDVSGITYIENSEEDTQGQGGNHILSLGIQSPVDETKSDQERLDQVVNQGGIPILSHPNAKDYPWSVSQLLSVKNYLGLEIFNSALFSYRAFKLRMGDYQAMDKNDSLFNAKIKSYNFAGDDYTPGDGGFDGGAIVVLANNNTQTAIMNNLKAGNFYAVQGSSSPRIKMHVENNTISVQSNKISKIKFIGNGGKTLQENEGLTTDNYEVQGDEIYVRVEVKSDGKTSWSQPIFVEREIISTPSTASEHMINLDQAVLKATTTEPITATTVNLDQAPTVTPPLGYLSPIYSFQTNGQVEDGTELTIQFPKDSNINASKISIYNYNESTKAWEKVPTILDINDGLATAELQHFSLYTLSAELTSETTTPEINLLSPTDTTNLGGEIKFKIETLDESGVTSFNASLDEIPIEIKKLENEGYETTINFEKYAQGQHILKLSAEDFFGNKSAKNYNVNSTSTFLPATVNIITPAENEYINGAFQVTGNIENEKENSSLNLLIDDVFLDKIDLTGNPFIFALNSADYRDGGHVIKLLLNDIAGNKVEKALNINFGILITAEITSPEAKAYGHSESATLNIAIEPTNLVYSLFLDSKQCTSNQIVMRDLTLGEHKLQVIFDNEVLDEVLFFADTSIQDQMILVQNLYLEGHMNRLIAIHLEMGLYKAYNAKTHDKQVVKLKKIIELLGKESDRKKASIDSYANEIISSDILYLINQGGV